MVVHGLNYRKKNGLKTFRTNYKSRKTNKPKTTVGIAKLTDETKSIKGSGIETDQAKQLDVLLNQSAKVLNKNCNTEETDTSTT